MGGGFLEEGRVQGFISPVLEVCLVGIGFKAVGGRCSRVDVRGS